MANNDGTPCPAPQTRCGDVCIDEATDSQNCGGCGLACDHCTNGRCIRVLASGQANPIALAVTSSEVVWANQGVIITDGSFKAQGAAILKVPIGGGAPETLAQSDTEPYSLAIDSSYVYWANADGAVMKTPLTGGATKTLASGQDLELSPINVAVSGGVVYWTAQGGIMSVPTSGGTPVVFQPGLLGPMTLAAGKAYWVEDEVQGSYVAIRTRELAPGTAAVNLVGWNKDGASWNPALGSFATVQQLAASTTDLYWAMTGGFGSLGATDAGSGSLVRVSLCGGTPSPIDDDDFDTTVTVDADSVYWASQDDSFISRILKAPLAGGAPITVAPTVDGLTSLVVDGTSLYYTDESTVVKVTPK